MLKKYFKIFVFSLLQMTILNYSAFANSVDIDTVKYLNISVNQLQSFDNELYIRFEANENICREKYGRNWWSICNPAIGERGKQIDSIKMTPEIEGLWKWDSSSALVFTPTGAEKWQALTNVKIELPKEIIPDDVKLSKTTITFITPIQSVSAINQRRWIDPSKNSKHVYSTNFQFFYPIKDKEAFYKNLTIAPQDTKSGLSLGKSEYIWSRNDTRLTINTPIQKLAPENAIIETSMKNMPRRGNLTGSLNLRDEIIGLNNAFYIENVNLNSQYNKELAQEFILRIRTSLHTTAEDIAKNLEVFALPKKSNEDARVPYNWKEAPVLDKGTKVKITSLHNAKDMRVEHAFKIDIPSEIYINFIISDKLKSSSDLKLRRAYTDVMYAGKYQASISFLQTGNILNLEGSKHVAVQTSQLTEIQWEAYKVRVPYLSFIADNYFMSSSHNARNNNNNYDEYYEDEEYYEDDYYDGDYDEGYGNNKISNNFNDYEKLSEIISGTIKIENSDQVSASSKVVNLDMTSLVKDFKTADTSGIIMLSIKGIQNGKEVASIQKMLLITDIGMIVKRNADGTRTVFAHSLSTSKPLNNIEIQVLANNGLPLTSSLTNSLGMARIENIEAFTRDKGPLAVVAVNKAKNDYSFISMNTLMRTVETSRFDNQRRMHSMSDFQAYVFAERGIFRPDDTLNFSAIIRASDNSLIPSLPLKAVLYNPQNVKVFETSYNLEDLQFGMKDFSWKSDYSSVTGYYRLDIICNNQTIGTRSVRLEEFQPDLLNLSAEILPAKKKGWYVSDEHAKLDLAITLTNLYGTPAQNRKINASMRLNSSYLYFNAYSNYTFNDPYRSNQSQNVVQLPQSQTDEQGKVTFNLDMKENIGNNSSYSAYLFIEGFEANGGRAVSTDKAFLISPAKSLIGYKTTGDILDLNYIPVKRKGQLEFIQINSDLEQDKDFEYTFIVSKKIYVRNLVQNNQGEYYYEETLVPEEVKREVLKSKDSKILWDIPSENAGEYILTVYAKDFPKNLTAQEKASHMIFSELSFKVVGSEIKLNPENIPSKMLLQVEKEKYNSGDKINVALALPYDGFGLITLEADQVLSYSWFNAKAGNTVQNITVPKDYEGRAYVVVSYMKDMDSQDIYLNPYSHAVNTVLINIDKRELKLEMNVAEEMKSGGNAKVTLKANQPAQAIVFAVDEGILALTNYVSPSPVEYFLKNKALEVATSQFADLIMPEMNAELKRNGINPQHFMLQAAFGGDIAFMESMAMSNSLARSAFGGDVARASGNFINPFKRKAEPPLVYWSKIVDISTKDTEISIPVPDYYNGNMRVMAVAVNKDAFGSIAKNTLIRNDLVLTPQFPVLASPKDILNASLSLSNTTDKDAIYILQTNLSDGLKFEGNQENQEITIKAGQEILLSMNFVVQDVLGEARAEFIAINKADESQKFSRASTLSVRPTAPYTTEIILGISQEKGEIKIDSTREIYSYEAQSNFTLSYAPVPFIQAMLNYLNTAYGYTLENTISRALPYVMLSKNPDLLYSMEKNPKEAEARANALINRAIYGIRSAQVNNGSGLISQGIALYGSSRVNPLMTIYAGDFFLALRKAGYTPPSDVEDFVFRSLRNIASQNPNSLRDARIIAYAIWVLTREGTITSRYLENIQDNLEGVSGWENDVTAVLIASSREILRLDGRSLVKDFKPDYSIFRASGFMDIFSAQALTIRALNFSFPDLVSQKSLEQFVSQSVSAFKRFHYGTFSLAQATSALWEIGIGNNTIAPIKQDILSCLDKDFTKLDLGTESIGISAPLCSQFQFNAPDTKTLYYQISTSGYDKNPVQEKVDNGLHIEKAILNEQGEVVEKVNIGDLITVRITANSYNTRQEDIVIQDLFAGAFELVLNDNSAIPYNSYSLVSREMREDRAIFFVNLSTDPSTFTYKLRAVNKGTFTVPAVHAHSLNDDELRANNVAQTIVIE